VHLWVHCWMHGGGGLSDTGVLLVCMVDKENEGGEREGEMKVGGCAKSYKRHTVPAA